MNKTLFLQINTVNGKGEKTIPVNYPRLQKILTKFPTIYQQ